MLSGVTLHIDFASVSANASSPPPVLHLITATTTGAQIDNNTHFEIRDVAGFRRFRDLVNNTAGQGTARNFEGKTVNLTSDIFLGGTGENWVPIGNTTGNTFSGIFDGGAHEINGLHINRNNSDNGLFGFAGGTDESPVEIKNLLIIQPNIRGTGTAINAVVLGNATIDSAVEIDNVHVRGGQVALGTFAGGIAGILSAGSISNSSVSGATVSSTHTSGGLIGRISNTVNTVNITDSSFEGTVTGVANVGGLVGDSLGRRINILRSYSSGTVTATVTAGIANCPRAGGLVGVVNTSTSQNTITDSFSTMVISATSTGTHSDVHCAGGLVGASFGANTVVTVSRSYFSGTVYARSNNTWFGMAGGIFAWNGSANSSINNSVSMATSIRAFATNRFSSSYFAAQVTHAQIPSGTNNRHVVLTGANLNPATTTDASSFIPFAGSSTVTRAQTNLQSTYEAIGWDFDTVWFMGANNLPALRDASGCALQRIIRNLRNQNRDLKDEIENLKSTHSIDISALQSTITSLNQTIATLTSQLDTSNTLASERLTEINYLNTQITALLATIESRNNTITNLEFANGILQSTLDQAITDRNTYHTNWQSELGRANGLFNDLATAIDNLAEKDAQILGLQEQLKDLQADLTKAETDRNTFHTNWQSELTRANNLQTQLTSAESARDEHFTDWQTAINETIPALQLALATATGDTTALQAELAKAVVARDEHFADWQTAINITIPKLQTDLVEAQTDRDKYYTNWQLTLDLIDGEDGIYERLLKALATIDINENDINNLISQLTSAQTDRDEHWDDLQNALGEISTLNSTIDWLNSEVDRLNALIKSDVDELQATITSLQDQIDALNDIIQNPESQQPAPAPSLLDSVGFWMVIVAIILFIISAIILAVYFNRNHRLFIRKEKVNSNG